MLMTLPDEPRWCSWCGASIPEDAHPRRLFCGKGCNNAYFNSLTAEARAAARAGLRCHACGQPFEAMRQDARYCSRRCSRRPRSIPTCASAE